MNRIKAEGGGEMAQTENIDRIVELKNQLDRLKHDRHAIGWTRNMEMYVSGYDAGDKIAQTTFSFDNDGDEQLKEQIIDVMKSHFDNKIKSVENELAKYTITKIS